MNLKILTKLVLNVRLFFNSNRVCPLEKSWTTHILANKTTIVSFFYGEGGGAGKGHVLLVAVVLYSHLL